MLTKYLRILCTFGPHEVKNVLRPTAVIGYASRAGWMLDDKIDTVPNLRVPDCNATRENMWGLRVSDSRHWNDDGKCSLDSSLFSLFA